MMDYSAILKNRIKKLCDDRGISSNKLATMSGLRQSTVENILLGSSRNPTVGTLHKIALAFAMTLSEFLDFPELNDLLLEEEDDLDDLIEKGRDVPPALCVIEEETALLQH